MWAVLSLLAPKRRPHRAPGRSFRPRVEALEERYCLSPGVMEWTDPTGQLDPTFGTGGAVTSSFSTGLNIAEDVLVQPDGKIVAGGWALISTKSSSSYDFVVARYNADGTLDTGFGSGGLAATDFGRGTTAEAYAVALQPGSNGKIVAGGFVDTTSKTQGTTSTSRHFALTRYNPNGTLDTSFGNSGKVSTDLGTTFSEANAMAVQPDGRIILVGRTASSGGDSLALARYTASGALDPTFGNGGKLLTGIPISLNSEGGHDFSVALQTDGRILVTGSTPDTYTPSDFLVARFNANGTTDTTFGGGAGWVTTDFGSRNDKSSGLSIQSDGRIVVVGYSQVPNSGDMSPSLARYNPDGSLDASFGAGGTLIAPFPQPSDPTQKNVGEATDVAVQTDGRIVVGGEESTDTLNWTYVSGSSKAIAELFNADGTVDTGYGPAGTGVSEAPVGDVSLVHAVAIQPDGRVVLAGQISTGTNSTAFALWRLLASAPQIGSFTTSRPPQ